jgi:microcystin-dependent protein
MRVVIALSGIFPSQGSGGVAAAFFGQIGTFVGSFVPGGWAEADGRLLSIMGNEALFSVIGTIYGGNGTSTFALPDLRGRVAVGANASNPVGSAFGVESNVVGLSQMPVHDHSEASGGTTASSGGNQSLNNDQPSLAVNYLIATRGIFPSNGGGLAGFDPDTQVLGQITEFAGNYAPDGWEIADGKLLQIAQNQALFSILGTTYGGDGQSTFALPDFRGRTAIGSGNGYDPGEVFGADTSFLSVANLPMHDHTASDSAQVPEPGSIALLCVGLFALGLGWRRPVRRTVFFSVRQRENTKMGLKMQFWRICSES